MEPIDAAHHAFSLLKREVSGYITSVDTEADTRLKVIDRILLGVLQWPFDQIQAEPATPSGFADYACHVRHRTRLILEAKRDGRSLGLQDRQPGRAYKLSGGVFSADTAKEGIAQAIRYCGDKNAELGCVTNGHEWIVFRGNRLGDGTDTREGVAFVFPGLDAVDEQFALFYSLISYESATRFSYRPYFQEAEGQPIRLSIFNKSLYQAGSAKFLPGGPLAVDIDKAMQSFFRRLSGDQDPDLLNACFVETNESVHADVQLARIAEDILDRIQQLDTSSADALTQLIQRVRESGRHEFVLIVGVKGAGKSTFITRFFDLVLPKALAEKCIVVRVDLGSYSGDVKALVPWLDATLVKEAERLLFDGAPGFNDIEGMFFDEYTRLRKGPWEPLYHSNKVEFRIKFGNHIEEIRQHDPHEYIHGQIRHVVNNRKMLPVIVFDNADHFDIEFQQRVYQYARSIYEQAVCLVILPITDRTSWQLSKHGALQSFEHEAFFLPAPPTSDIIRKRIEFIEKRIEAEKTKPEDRYFVSRGISLSVEDLSGFARTLHRIFLQTSDVARWIGDLANHDVRRTLNLARQFVISPHLRVEDLIKAYVAGSGVLLRTGRAARALIRGHYDIYPAGQNDFVQNVFALNADLATSPLLGVRLLQLLNDVPQREHEGGLIDIDDIVAYVTGMNIETRATYLWLDALLKSGLVLNYDPTVQDVTDANRIEISPAGRHHFFWATGNLEYLSAMADVTPLLSETTFTAMLDYRRPQRWRKKTVAFLDYLLAEDAMYCSIPEHDAYQSQVRLRRTLETIGRHLTEADAPRTARRVQPQNSNATTNGTVRVRNGSG